MTYTIETTKKNLEEAYGERWHILGKTLACPALELHFSTDETGALDKVDAVKLSRQQDKKAGIQSTS